MKVRRTSTLSSSRSSDISVGFGGGRRHGANTVARFTLVIRLSLHLQAYCRSDGAQQICRAVEDIGKFPEKTKRDENVFKNRDGDVNRTLKLKRVWMT